MPADHKNVQGYTILKVKNMELKQIGKNTYYIENATNIGIYKTDDNNVYLIDSGNDKEAGKKILKIINAEGWNIKGIISTHSNADHIGGNKFIQDRTDCKIYADKIEKCFTQYPILEPSFLYGGYPFKDLRHKFLLAKESVVTEIENNLPDELEYFPLKGHFFDMIGIRTSDDAVFLADALFSEETIEKYHIFFIYDVKAYLNTLQKLKELKAKIFIPSHCKATDDISHLIKLNENKINEIANTICDYCKNETAFEEILKYIFDKYSLTMNANQYVLVGSTIKSFLSYLYDEEKLTYEFRENKMLWKQA